MPWAMVIRAGMFMENNQECLFSVQDITRVRELLYKEQKGIDPILKETIALSGSVLDHSHITQRCRAVLHRQSNSWEGLVFNSYRRCMQWVTEKPLPELLRNLADYYEDTERVEHTKPYHPGWIKRLCTDFASLNEQEKKDTLEKLGQPTGSNATERKTLFRKALLTRKFSYNTVKDLINQKKGIK